jgi:hypothetical protein
MKIKFAEAMDVTNQLALNWGDWPGVQVSPLELHKPLKNRRPFLAVVKESCDCERRVREMQCDPMNVVDL